MGMDGRSWMMFVDGENFTFRAQKIAHVEGIALTEGDNYKRDCFVWVPQFQGTSNFTRHLMPNIAPLETFALRSYYYTSLQGDTDAITAAREVVRRRGFEPKIFKRNSSQRQSKGVDIALATDMLAHAFQAHYEVAVLVAGDADYLPLVEQVKRLGRSLHVWFFVGPESGLADELRLAADLFFDIGTQFVNQWRGATGRQ